MAKTVFITGASRGFGKLWAEALLQKGNNVAATARELNNLEDLAQKYGSKFLPLQLDVNDRAAGFAAVALARKHFGTIDVLINNAGYGLFGSIEETSEKEARAQMETNFFGLLWLTQAIIPVMREQGHGHIIQITSALGLVTLPILGLYNASKFAVEGLSETLASEVKQFGIHVTIVEPNGYATDWAGASAFQTAQLQEYDVLRDQLKAATTEETTGVPEATTPAILQLIDSTNPPLRLLLGNQGYVWIKQAYEERLATWNSWKEISFAAQGK